MSLLQQLTRINERVNRRIQYQEDQADHWQTPAETLGRGAGDCEDYAILKLAEVLRLGFNEDDVRLVYCRRQLGRITQTHMVLEVWVEGEAWVLDNLGLAINRWSDRTDLHPLFSFTARKFWVRGALTDVDPQQRLGQWRDVVARASRQGVGLASVDVGEPLVS